MKVACCFHVHFIDYNEKANNQVTAMKRTAQLHVLMVKYHFLLERLTCIERSI